MSTKSVLYGHAMENKCKISAMQDPCTVLSRNMQESCKLAENYTENVP